MWLEGLLWRLLVLQMLLLHLRRRRTLCRPCSCCSPWHGGRGSVGRRLIWRSGAFRMRIRCSATRRGRAFPLHSAGFLQITLHRAATLSRALGVWITSLLSMTQLASLSRACVLGVSRLPTLGVRGITNRLDEVLSLRSRHQWPQRRRRKGIHQPGRAHNQKQYVASGEQGELISLVCHSRVWQRCRKIEEKAQEEANRRKRNRVHPSVHPKLP